MDSGPTAYEYLRKSGQSVHIDPLFPLLHHTVFIFYLFYSLVRMMYFMAEVVELVVKDKLVSSSSLGGTFVFSTFFESHTRAG
jgi:hypothetical protein